jgi:hypothetical protein
MATRRFAYGDPALRYGDPALRYGDPALRYGDPALRYGDPALRYGDPARQKLALKSFSVYTLPQPIVARLPNTRFLFLSH